jgi:hypothetical protein
MYHSHLRSYFGVSSLVQRWPLVAMLFILVSGAQIPEAARAESIGQTTDWHLEDRGEGDRAVQVLANAPLANGPAVSSLSDVMPSDWAFQALRNLVETYGCIQGYPDGTFKGARSLTRYEFAAGLNACLEVITGLIAQSAVNPDDIGVIQRLQEEYRGELSELSGRVDSLEVETAALRAQQFSTTTKLFGVGTVYLAGAAGDTTAASYIPTVEGLRTIRPAEALKDNPVVQYSTLLSFNTSITGPTDRLSVDLWTSNITPFSSSIFGVTENVTGTNQTRLSYDAPPYNGEIGLADLIYQFQPVKNLSVFLDAVGGEVSGELLYATQPFTVLAPYTNSISRFGRYDPIYYQTLARPGVAVNYDFTDSLSLGGGYYGDFITSYKPAEGFFGGSNAVLAQLSMFPTDTLGMTLVYVRSYSPEGPGVAVSGGTGSLYADQPFGTTFVPGPGGSSIPASIATTADNLSWGFGWRPISKLAFTGNVGVSFAHAEQDNPTYNVTRGDGATLFQWKFGLVLPDLFKEGNVGSLMVGNPYRVVSHSSDYLRPEGDTAWHVELAYKHNFNRNLSIQPGFLLVMNPENNAGNPAIGVFQIKTQFLF